MLTKVSLAAVSSHMIMELLQWRAQVKKVQEAATVTHVGPKKGQAISLNFASVLYMR